MSFSFRGMKEANPPWSQAACRCWFSPVPRRGPSRGGPRGRSRAARPLPLGCVREQWFQAAWGGSCVLCVLLLGHSPLCFSAVPRFQQLLVLVVCFGCGFFCFLFFFLKIFSLTLLFGTSSALVFALLMDASFICLAHSAGHGQSLTRLSARG